MKIRKAAVGDLPAVMEMLASGREHQRKLGFEQWPASYPSEELVLSDIELGRGYIVADGDVPVACVVIDTAGDPEYDAAEGLWLCRGSYAAVHRLAIAPRYRGCGICRQVLELIADFARQRGIDLLRAETGLPNKPMQRTLVSAGFRLCGPYQFSWGPRLAYELDCRH